jgi:hypothetical protein
MMLMNHPLTQRLRELSKNMDERCMSRTARRAIVDPLFIELLGETNFMGFELITDLEGC